MPASTAAGVDLAQHGSGARACGVVGTPITMRSGRSVSSHGEALAQELRVPDQVDVDAGAVCAASRSRSRAAVPTGTVDLPTTSAVAAQVRGERVDGGVDELQVGGELAWLLRRADAEEVHVGEPRRLGRRRW